MRRQANTVARLWAPAPCMQARDGMDTYKLEEGSRILAAISWRAIAAGVVVALALQILLLLFGLALAVSVGDRVVGDGFAWWGFVVQLATIAVGAALAARISQARSQLAGMVAGALTWAVAVVIGGAAFGGMALAGATRVGTSGAWAAFFGILLGLGAALAGGAFGIVRDRERRVMRTPPAAEAPIGPAHTEPA